MEYEAERQLLEILIHLGGSFILTTKGGRMRIWNRSRRPPYNSPFGETTADPLRKPAKGKLDRFIWKDGETWGPTPHYVELLRKHGLDDESTHGLLVQEGRRDRRNSNRLPGPVPPRPEAAPSTHRGISTRSSTQPGTPNNRRASTHSSPSLSSQPGTPSNRRASSRSSTSLAQPGTPSNRRASSRSSTSLSQSGTPNRRASSTRSSTSLSQPGTPNRRASTTSVGAPNGTPGNEPPPVDTPERSGDLLGPFLGGGDSSSVHTFPIGNSPVAQMYQQAIQSPFVDRARRAQMEGLLNQERILLAGQAERRREARARDFRFQLVNQRVAQGFASLTDAHQSAAAHAANCAIDDDTQQHMEILNNFIPHYLHSQGSTQEETEPEGSIQYNHFLHSQGSTQEETEPEGNIQHGHFLLAQGPNQEGTEPEGNIQHGHLLLAQGSIQETEQERNIQHEDGHFLLPQASTEETEQEPNIQNQDTLAEGDQAPHSPQDPPGEAEDSDSLEYSTDEDGTTDTPNSQFASASAPTAASLDSDVLKAPPQKKPKSSWSFFH